MINIINLIPVGKANAITCKELSRLTGVSHRAIKGTISKCRRKGGIICSSLDDNNGGYFIYSNIDELREYVRSEQTRIDTAQAALQSAIKELERISNNG